LTAIQKRRAVISSARKASRKPASASKTSKGELQAGQPQSIKSQKVGAEPDLEKT
jgi:hypothetical protein